MSLTFLKEDIGMIISDDNIFEEIMSSFGKMISATNVIDLREYQRKIDDAVDSYCKDGKTTCLTKDNMLLN